MVATGEETNEDSGEYEHDEVDDLKAVWSDATSDGDWKSENDANIEDVATDDIADEEIGFAFSRGGDGGDELGKRSAEGDDGEGNDAFGDTNSGSDGASGIYDELATADDTGETYYYKEEGFAEFVFGLFNFFSFLFVFASERNNVIKKDGEE